MAPESPMKRGSPSQDENPPAKRLRTESSTIPRPDELPVADSAAAAATATQVPEPPNEYHTNRRGLQRGLALALDHVGFDSASEEALESFTIMTETYLTSLIKDVTTMANHARRTTAIAPDFELSLNYFNINLTDLKKHRKPPIPQERIKGTEPQIEVKKDKEGRPILHDGAFEHMPCLDKELSGEADKDAKAYIPKSFPDFPSTHTYKYTPTDIESVTVREDIVSTAKENAAPNWRGDPKKIREAAAIQAKQAEEALRKLVRASKMASLKDLRSTAEKNPISKARYDLWEDAMKDLLQERGLADGRNDAVREDVADHSMIVNAQKKYHRREIPRSAKRMGDTLSGKG